VHNDGIIGRIKSPQDLYGLDFSELSILAAEIRDIIISTVSRNGGHLSSNLGVVELTIALHRELRSGQDVIVWDVGHQCYTHKIITGRCGQFSTLRSEGGLAGFPKTAESPYDCFNTGHASTSISAALGLLVSKSLQQVPGEKSCVAAVIGDGALTGGMAYEALSHAGQLGLPLMVILNDNKMSISPNVGGLSKYLSRLSMKANYQNFRRTFDTIIKKIPYAGETLFDFITRLKRAVKAVFYHDNFFVDLGFEYVGPIDGHNIPLLCSVIHDAKNLGKPVVIHVITRKGRGYSLAETEPEAYHGVSSSWEPGSAGEPSRSWEPGSAGEPSRSREPTKVQTFTEVFGEALIKAATADSRITAVTAAMEKGTGLTGFKQKFPQRFFDVGIAEEHAVTFAAGLARGGLRPVAAIYSTFIQRAVDQVIHDVCLQNLPVVFALDRAGLVSDDGETHQGFYDISLFLPAPNITLLAPASGGELELMLEWALSAENSGPAMIRYPKDNVPSGDPALLQKIEKGRGVFVRRSYGQSGTDILIIFTGSLYRQALEAADILEEQGLQADLYNLRFLKPVDEDYLVGIINNYEFVLIAEEGISPGGFGSYAAEFALKKNCSSRIGTLGITGKLDAQAKRGRLLAKNNLDAKGIAAAVMELLPDMDESAAAEVSAFASDEADSGTSRNAKSFAHL